MSLGFSSLRFYFILLFGTFSFVSLWWDAWSWGGRGSGVPGGLKWWDSQTHPTFKKPSAVPCLSGALEVRKQVVFFPCIVQVPFKLLMFCCVPGSVSLHLGSLAISLPSARHCTGSGVPTGTVSPCLYYQFRCGPSICSSCLVSLQIFRRNYSICRCRFGVLMGGSQFRVSSRQYLGTL